MTGPADDRMSIYEAGWRWFEVHAQQRMQLISFWFVAMSFLSTGAAVAYSEGEFGATLLISLAVVGASILFQLLDQRTQELIKYGEEVMRQIEESWEEDSSHAALRLVSGLHDSNRSRISYRVLFSSLYFGAAALGTVAGIASIVSL